MKKITIIFLWYTYRSYSVVNSGLIILYGSLCCHVITIVDTPIGYCVYIFAQHPSMSDHNSSFYGLMRCIEVLVCATFFLVFSSHVPLHVQGEMVGPGEGPFAQVTLERPVTGVLPEVTRELIGTSELPAATLPAAVVWFLSYKHNNNKAAVSDVIDWRQDNDGLDK